MYKCNNLNYFTFRLAGSESCSVVSNSMQPHALSSPWSSPGQNTRVGSLSLLHGIFPIQIELRSPALQVDSLPAEPERGGGAWSNNTCHLLTDPSTLCCAFLLIIPTTLPSMSHTFHIGKLKIREVTWLVRDRARF